MITTPEQFAAANKASMDALFTVATAQFAAFERPSALNFNTTKAAFEDGVSQAKALLSVKDAQEFVSLSSAAAQPSLKKRSPTRAMCTKWRPRPRPKSTSWPKPRLPK